MWLLITWQMQAKLLFAYKKPVLWSIWNGFSRGAKRSRQERLGQDWNELNWTELNSWCCTPYSPSLHRLSQYTLLCLGCFRLVLIVSVRLSSVQFGPLTDWVVAGTWGTTQQKSSSSFFVCGKPSWAITAWAGRSACKTVWKCVQCLIPRAFWFDTWE